MFIFTLAYLGPRYSKYWIFEVHFASMSGCEFSTYGRGAGVSRTGTGPAVDPGRRPGWDLCCLSRPPPRDSSCWDCRAWKVEIEVLVRKKKLHRE